ncbi:MAG: FAD-dependent oxidoreductase, partial [Gammaproteobacteria bacterium]|nr:FAD-dependent oxidoreductase [Gammaproteobacteria bacterium]
MTKSKFLLVAVLIVFIGSFFVFDLGRFFNLEFFKSKQTAIGTYYAANPLKTAAIYFLIYVAVTGLSLPGAVIMTLAGGAIFGLLWATILVSFASVIGATLAFLVSRFLLRDSIQNRYRENLRSVNKGIEKDGAFYLFTLRLVPLFPFFVINLVMGLTPIRTVAFALVSQLGMFPGTLVYVNAGTQIAKIESLSGILSPGLLLSFALLGLFPLAAKKFVDYIKTHKVLKGHRKPKRFDRNLVVIGAGSAGLVSAYIAAAVKSKVTLIEKHKMGGDCLNTGCVPSKALLRSAKFLSHIRRAEEFGFKSATAEFEFTDVMQRIQEVIRRIEPKDSVERYTKLGVECIEGEAHITSPYSVAVNGQSLTTRSIIVAAGGRPFVPPIPGIDAVGYLTSDTVWNLRTLPDRLVVLGGGPIGCELAQAFARFGSQVTQIEMLPRILIREDEDISALVAERFAADGVDVRTEHRAKQFIVENGNKILICEHDGKDVRIEFDEVLVAVGRHAHLEGFGAEELGIAIAKTNTLEVNDFLQTNFPNIFACGDVAGPYQFTHVAGHQAWYASINALFGAIWKFKVDYSVIPWATFTEPEVARVGLNEQEATEQRIPFEVTRY